MYSNEDFENFYVRYKAEGLPKGMSIQSWCMKNKVSWNLFNNYKVIGEALLNQLNLSQVVPRHPTQDSTGGCGRTSGRGDNNRKSHQTLPPPRRDAAPTLLKWKRKSS